MLISVIRFRSRFLRWCWPGVSIPFHHCFSRIGPATPIVLKVTATAKGDFVWNLLRVSVKFVPWYSHEPRIKQFLAI